MDPNRLVRNWLKQQMEEYDKTPALLSELVGGVLSERTVMGLRDGSVLRTTIPKETKNEIVPKLEAVLGPMPKEKSSPTMFRPADLQARPPALTDEVIQGWLEETDSSEPNNVANDSGQPSIEPSQGSFDLGESEWSVEETGPVSPDIPGDKLPQNHLPSNQDRLSSEAHYDGAIIEYCSRCSWPITDDTKPCLHCSHPCDRSY